MIKKIFPLIYIKDINFSLENRSILCVENFYFHIFKVNVENIINEEDRLLKIQDYLEIVFPQYNSSDFILRYEFLKKEKDYEELVVYLLNLEAFKKNNIHMDNNNYKLLSIIPSFFKAREFKENSNFYIFDISKKVLIISKHSSNKLEDIKLFHTENLFIPDTNEPDNSFANIINSFLINVERNYDIVFTGIELEYSELELENKNYSFFEVNEIDFIKYPNFLPEKLQRKNILYFLNYKYLFFISILITISLFLCLFLYYKIHMTEKELQNLENQTALLEEKNTNLRNELKELEENRLEFEKEKNRLSKNSFKISDFLNELKYLVPKNIFISSIEYDGKKTLSIVGSGRKIEDINLFLENILNSNKIELENYDYILERETEIEFKVELNF
ncbi:MAG: fimbrial assembly protein [Fusobacterium sp.]|uniref:PilN domain-containing protein n=1 Tax=Fusobacterium sp. TaxID=68766 RepID=UPI0026DB74E7|nr:PilN domain-containing protein [Fusobacterium sp.]MDO4690587.1 fimbrial assembly protein [Fusobacterium sp.]